MQPTPAPTIDIGIPEADRLTIATELERVLADTYTLYLKTHNYHWNVTGPMFNTLHLMFEEQYNELWTAVDLIAPGSSARFAELTSIAEADDVPTAEQISPTSSPATKRSPAPRSAPPRRPATSRPPTCSSSASRSTRRRRGCCARCSPEHIERRKLPLPHVVVVERLWPRPSSTG